jgi:hypothetical protein
LPTAAVAVLLTAAPTLAWQPPQIVSSFGPALTGRVSDMVARGPNVVLTVDLANAGVRGYGMFWSVDGGVTWGSVSSEGQTVSAESSAGVCAGHAVVAHVADPSPAERQIETFAYALEGPPTLPVIWSGSSVPVRQPDVTCLAGEELAVAWLQRAGDGHVVKLKTGDVFGVASSPQSFGLGAGSPSRELSITATSDRVYVTWFDGPRLRLARFRIGSTSAHTLTRLGTATIATLSNATAPVVGADGSRVVLAYRHDGDLRVRRSSDKGISFGAARIVRDGPSGANATPTTVVVRGPRVAIGAVEIKGSSGKALGYRSTDGGSSYTQVSSHSSGYKVVTLVRPPAASTYRYAEAWDQAFPVGDPIGSIRYRRE